MKEAEALQRFTQLQKGIQALSKTYCEMYDPGSPGRVRPQFVREYHGTNEPIYAAMQHLEVVEKQLHMLEAEYREAQQVINRVLGRLEDKPLLKTIMIEYYALGHTDAEIAEMFNLSVRTINKMRNTFMNKLDKEAA